MRKPWLIVATNGQGAEVVAGALDRLTPDMERATRFPTESHAREFLDRSLGRLPGHRYWVAKVRTEAPVIAGKHRRKGKS